MTKEEVKRIYIEFVTLEQAIQGKFAQSVNTTPQQGLNLNVMVERQKLNDNLQIKYGIKTPDLFQAVKIHNLEQDLDVMAVKVKQIRSNEEREKVIN